MMLTIRAQRDRVSRRRRRTPPWYSEKRDTDRKLRRMFWTKYTARRSALLAPPPLALPLRSHQLRRPQCRREQKLSPDDARPRDQPGRDARARLAVRAA